MIKVRTKAPSLHIHKCHKQSCQGAQNPLQNYISATSRHTSPYPSKNKKSKSTKHLKKKADLKKQQNNNHSAVNQLLQESYLKLKQENQDLQKKLVIKKKKVNDLKQKLKNCQVRLAFVQRQSAQANNQSKDSPKKSGINEKYGEIVAASQNLAKQTLQRYRVLQDEYLKYKQITDKKMNKLMKQKDQILVSVNRQQNHRTEKQVQSLRKQIKKLRQEHMTAQSLKNLNANNNSSQRYQRLQKMQRDNSKLKQSNQCLKSENGRLQNHIDNLQNEIKTMSMISKGRQQELRGNLDLISEKVSNWELEYRKIQENSIEWQIKYNRLYQKYEKRRQKHKRNNEEWAGIFRQFITEIDKLKRQLEIVSQRNLKLIKMYANQ